MRTLILLAGLACACDAHRVQSAEEDAASASTKAHEWESKNFARYSARELNDAELGVANLMNAVHDPSALAQMKQMLENPEILAEMKKQMASPSFQAQMTRVVPQSAAAPVAGKNSLAEVDKKEVEGKVAQEEVSKAGARQWELDNTASYTAGESSLAELGTANLLAAVSDPSVMAEAVQMLRKPDNIAMLKKMRSDPDFQQEVKRVAEKVGEEAKSIANEMTANSDGPQSLAQVMEVKAQGGDKATWLPAAANPTAAFTAPAAVSHGLANPLQNSKVTMLADKGDFQARGPPASPEFVKSLAGISEPLGYFDPLGFADGQTEGKIRFFREVELKHGRVAMLAALGWLVAEQFHPLFGGNIDGPSYTAFQQTPLETFWPAVVAAIAIPEIYSVQTFERAEDTGGEQWLIRSDHEPGDFGFDPLGLKPGARRFPKEKETEKDKEALKLMQTKELNNGRLAMLAIAGMAAQEFANGQKIFMNDAAAQEWLKSGY